MSDDKYTQRLESLFSNTEHVPPDPGQPATPPEAPDVEAMQARMAEMEAAAAEARRQVEEERAQRAAAAADAENLRARMAELEAAAQRRPTTVVESSSQTELGTVEKTAPRSEMPGVRSHARPTSGWRKTLFGVPALRAQLAEADKDKVRARNTFRVSLVMFIAAAVTDVYAFYLSFQNGLWQGYVSSGLLLAFALVAGVSAILSRRGRHELGIWLLLGSLALLMPATSTLLAGVGLVLCLALIVETSVFAGITLPPRRASWAITVSVFAGLAALLIDVFGPTDRLALPSTFREVYLPASAALVVAIYGVFLWRQFPNFSLRTKIVLGVILITALSAAAMTYFAYYRTQQSQTFLTDQLQINVSEQAEHELGDTALREARAADRAISDVTDDVVALAEYRASLYAQASTLGQGAYWDGHTKITRLPTGQFGNPGADIGSVFIPSTVTLDEALIADLNASAYLDFVAPAILKARANMVALYFINTRSATTYYPNINLASVVPPDFDPTTQPFYTDAAPASNPERKPVWTAPYQDPAGNGLMVTNAMPVYDQVGEFKGVLAADVQLTRMAEQVSAIKAGQSGYAFLIDLAGRIIAMPDAGYKAFGLHPETVPVNETPKQVILGAGPTDLQTVTFRMVAGETGLASVVLEGVENYVAYAPLSSIGYSLGIIVPVAELNAPYLTTRDQIRNDANTTSRQTSILLVVLLAAAVGVSLAMGQFIASPLARLTETARQITVGNLNAQARVETEDETGTLARTFNTMTAQLREMLHGLEERVAERTRDLALAAEVGQRVSAVRDLDALLAEAVETIRARFDLYYTQIYLTNPGGTALVLRAGTGAVGQELLRRNHRLPLGPGSINGAAASENRPVLVADTAASGVFRPNPLLPDTRSEVSVPLVVGERVVGVLDLQSTQPGTFTADNLPAFQALAGQLAIAIENADLFATTQQAREAVEAEARRLTRDSWQEFLNAVDRNEHLGFVYDQASLAPLTEPLPPGGEQALTVPIVVTGEPVGVLQLEAEANRIWTEAEAELVSSVARQVAQQVENLRLLAEAERSRAEAEQATRRLTRESWQDYLEHDTVSAQGYVYDLNQVAPLTPAPQGEATLALTWPLKVQGETIGELAVGELPEKLSDEAAELITAVSEQLSAHIENLRLTEQTGRALAQTEQQAGELRALFAAMPDVVLVYDEQGRYVRIAPTNPSLLYKPPAEMLGKTLTEVLPAAQAEAFMGYIRQVLDTRGTLNIEYSLPIGGQEIWFSATVTPLTANTVFWIARDITERKQAEEEILKFKLGIERSTDAVFITDPQGTIVYVNPSFEEVYGYSREEALGQTPRLLKSGLVPLEGYKQFWATLLGKGVVAGEIVNKTKDGRLITIEGSNSPILDEAGNIVGFLAAHRDITDRKQAEETLRRQHAYQGALQEITLGLIGRLELTDLLQDIITRAGELIGTTHGYIFLLEPDEAEMRMHVGTGTYNSFIDYRLKPGQAVVGTIWQTGEPLVIDDYQAWANRLHLKNLEAVRAVVGAPLKSGSQVVGVIGLAYLEEGRRFGEDEVAVLSRFAQLASVALDNARLFEQTQMALVEADNSAKQAQTLIQYAPEAVVVVDVDTGLFIEPNENAERLYGLSRAELLKVGPAHMSPPTQPDGRPSLEKAIEKITEAMSGGAPVFEWMHRNAQGRDISCEVRLVRMPSPGRNLVRASVTDITERKRTEAVLAKRATELQTVAKVSTAASTILEARILLQNVVDLTKDNFGLYHTHIYLVDGPTGMLVLTAGAGEVGRRMVSEGRSIALSRMQSLVARAAREREAVIVNDVRAAPDFLPHPLLPDTRSEMAVPMIAGDQLLGVFDVQHDQPGYFTEEDVRIQTALAAQVAVALQNANLYAEQAAIVTRLRELDHLKSTFLANMSHELRTPLNSILGFTDVMIEGLDGPLTDLMESDLKVVQKNGKHLLNLINDVLDMAKIEAGKMSLSLERFNLQEVLEEVVEIIGPLARDKALDLRIATEPTDELDLTADRIRLRQVMINLVGNAIKFTEQGGITLQAMQHNGSVRVAIRDTGFGIPPDKLEAIFEAFSQVDTSTTRKAGGTGLGLPISRRLIELHGGRLWAESSGMPGEGSTFFVELPLEAQEVAV